MASEAARQSARPAMRRGGRSCTGILSSRRLVSPAGYDAGAPGMVAVRLESRHPNVRGAERVDDPRPDLTAADYPRGMSVEAEVQSTAKCAREASLVLALATRAQKDTALHRMADALLDNADAITKANEEDVSRPRRVGSRPTSSTGFGSTAPAWRRWRRVCATWPGSPIRSARCCAEARWRTASRAAPGQGAVRCRGHHLRGPTRRDRRRRWHLPQVRQCGAAAGQLRARGRAIRRSSPRSAPPSRTPACRRMRSN